MNDLQQHIQEAAGELVMSGVERGLQVAVCRNGTLVTDAVAGIASLATGRPVTSDMPFFSYSIGEGRPHGLEIRPTGPPVGWCWQLPGLDHGLHVREQRDDVAQIQLRRWLLEPNVSGSSQAMPQSS